MDKINHFNEIANRYDLVNDVVSLGVHRYWKNFLCKKIKYGSLIDVASGTGDIAIKFFNSTKDKKPYIVACDPNQYMLQVAKKKCPYIEYVNSFAEDLKFEDNTFDNYTISFGIRNADDIEKTLNEAYRVLKPGGQFLCLEFNNVQNKLYNFYLHNIIPWIGRKITGANYSYKYLANSINQFYTIQEFMSIINQFFYNSKYYDFGFATLYQAFKN